MMGFERRTHERGASAVEYSLIVVAVAAIIVVIVFAVGRLTKESFDTTCSSLASGDFNTTATCS
jgi:pilus assembly protein Flp/PilA